jgi:hypothetical protein
VDGHEAELFGHRMYSLSGPVGRGAPVPGTAAKTGTIVADAADNNRADGHSHSRPASKEFTVTQPVFPAGRYGRRRSRGSRPRWAVPALAAVAGAACLAGTWWLYQSNLVSAVHYQVLRYDQVTDRQVRVVFEVVKPSGEPAQCVVRARSRDGTEVGREVVDVPAGHEGDKSVIVTHVLITTARPVTGEVTGCGLRGR